MPDMPEPNPTAAIADPPRHSPEVSIILPALNEAAALGGLVSQLHARLARESYEVVFVDDGSDDDTWGVIRAILDSRPDWQGIRLSRRFGQQAALLAGLRAARGRAVIMMDADGQHPPELLPEMLRRWRDGAPVVQALREDAPDCSATKRWTSRAFYALFSRICESPIVPGAADFRLLDRSVVDTLLTGAGPAPFLRGLIPWLGCRTEYVRYTPQSRIGGETKYSPRQMLKLALHGLLSFSVLPLRIATVAGAGLGAFALAYLAYITSVGLLSSAAVPGWASTTGLVALIGAVQLFSIGLLGEYVGRTYAAVLDRPSFVVAERYGAATGDRHVAAHAMKITPTDSRRTTVSTKAPDASQPTGTRRRELFAYTIDT